MRNLVTFFLLLLVLLAVGVSVAKSPWGRNVLIRAAAHGNAGIVRFLCALGGAVNGQDESGGTALFYAAANGHTDVVRALLRHGADATITDKQGNTALCYALDTAIPNKEIVEQLVRKGSLAKQLSHSNPLMCIEHSSSSASYIELLIGLGTSVDVPAGEYTPLMKFSYDGNAEAVDLLLRSGAQVNAVTIEGKTALGEAALQGNPDVVEILLKKGAVPATTKSNDSLATLVKGRVTEYERANPAMLARYQRVLQLLGARQ
jgi:ankyrin repeat protein